MPLPASQLADGLAAVAGRLEPAEAAGCCNQALAQEKDSHVPRGQLTGAWRRWRGGGWSPPRPSGC